jgi:hypothetical protein
MKTLGTLKKIEGKTYAYIGNIEGRVIFGYSEKIRGDAQIRLMEAEERDLVDAYQSLSPNELNRFGMLERKIAQIVENPNQLKLI